MVAIPPSPMGEIVSRRASALVAEALADTRVVLIEGARQCGKSTLATQLAQADGRRWATLDRAADRLAAQRDPTTFVRLAPTMAIDEVQRAPELLLAIKELVDAQPDPGRFLLTGSSRPFGLRPVPDTLPGRMETVELWPLSQGEIDRRPDGFVRAAFALGPELRHDTAEERPGYIERLLRGGFPGAVARSGLRRRRFHQSYLADLVNRDVMQLSAIERGAELRALVRLLAARSGQSLVTNSLANALRLSQPTVARHLALLEEVFLIKHIPAWSRNLGARAVRTPKVAFVDSGVAAHVIGQDAAGLSRLDSPLGHLLEGFVAMEIARQLTWADQIIELSHYRTRDQLEVDLVLESARGQVVAIEVKAAATLNQADFRGLKHLADRLGDDLVAGYVLYLGPTTLPFGPKFRAVPVSALWEVSGPADA
ncbi:MAG: ATP-binding protein [Propionibacteriaceae bacterium]|nr:ATP-binding protein [Propionibacteriaceae bacterium]